MSRGPRDPTKRAHRATGGPRGGSKKGSHKNASEAERKHFNYKEQTAAQNAKAKAYHAARRATNKALGKAASAEHRRFVITTARFLEFGTSKMNANPFMSRAFEAQKEAAEASIQAGIKALLGL